MESSSLTALLQFGMLLRLSPCCCWQLPRLRLCSMPPAWFLFLSNRTGCPERLPWPGEQDPCKSHVTNGLLVGAPLDHVPAASFLREVYSRPMFFSVTWSQMSCILTHTYTRTHTLQPVLQQNVLVTHPQCTLWSHCLGLNSGSTSELCGLGKLLSLPL